MAQPPGAETSDAPSQATRSHGRGGAGNINAKPATQVNAEDLQTPTIKSSTYTTGRGGSGNMAKNDPLNPDEARAAQDVDAPSHHNKDMQGTYHWGRGGEGNMTTIGRSEKEQRERSKERASLEKKRERALSKESDERRGSFQNAINKGKELLGLRKNAATPTSAVAKNESAVE